LRRSRSPAPGALFNLRDPDRANAVEAEIGSLGLLTDPHVADTPAVG
jgi:hypothetical protein